MLSKISVAVPRVLLQSGRRVRITGHLRQMQGTAAKQNALTGHTRGIGPGSSAPEMEPRHTSRQSPEHSRLPPWYGTFASVCNSTHFTFFFSF